MVSAGSTHISPSDASATARPSGQPCRSGAVQGAGHEAENLVGEAGDACPTEEGRQVSRGERWSSGAGGLLADDLQDGGRPEVEPGQRADSCEACPGIIPAQPPVQPSPRIGPGSGHILRCPRHIHGQGTRSPKGRDLPADFQPKKVIFAILLKNGEKLTPDTLFPFSQVTLASAARELESRYQIPVEVIGIEAEHSSGL